MPKPADTIPCGHCDGTGRYPLSGVHMDTLKLLREQKVPISGAEMGRLFGCTGEAASNRLRYLGRLGFAGSVRNGRERLWTATK